MMTNGESIREGGSALTQRPAGLEEPAWVVVKSLLEVNDACTDTLEEFLLYSATDRLDDLPADDLSARLDDLIERQRRTVTELELAREAIEEIDSQ